MTHESIPEAGTRAKRPRLCVYTTLIGQYEQLNEQPVAAKSTIPFICLTDDPDLKSESWEIRLVTPVFGMDPIRSQRDLKLRPHLYLPDFDASLYMDNSVALTQPPERIFEQYFSDSCFCLPEHSFRDSTLDEFLEVARAGLDDQNRIFEQLNHYMVDCPDALNEKPYWAGIMLRDHRDPRVRAMLETWAAHVNRYSRRDQLSVNASFRHAGLTPDVMRIDNFVSWFHSWPHCEGRDREKGMRRPGTSLMPPVGRLRQLEQAFAEQVNDRQAILASRTWRIASVLGEFAHRHPRLARYAWNGFRLFGWVVTLQFFRNSMELFQKSHPESRSRRLVKTGAQNQKV